MQPGVGFEQHPSQHVRVPSLLLNQRGLHLEQQAVSVHLDDETQGVTPKSTEFGLPGIVRELLPGAAERMEDFLHAAGHRPLRRFRRRGERRWWRREFVSRLLRRKPRRRNSNLCRFLVGFHSLSPSLARLLPDSLLQFLTLQDAGHRKYGRRHNTDSQTKHQLNGRRDREPGSAVADASAIGSMLIPWLKKLGYPAPFAAGTLAAAATIDILIPPSIPMIVYALVSGASAIRLAGFFGNDWSVERGTWANSTAP